jgi:ribosome-associated translation inhibitor RaiA
MKLNNVSNGNELKINLAYRGLNPGKIWRRLVEGQVRKLRGLAAILSARITLEHQREVQPGFRVFATLEVPGPDYHAEARDYTLQAALLKVIDNLRRQMQSRKNRQLERRKNSSKVGLMHGRARFVLNAVRGAARGFGPQRSASV